MSDLLELREQTLSLLSEASDSVVGELAAEDGTVAESTVALLNRFLNDAAARMCRAGYALNGYGTLTLSARATNFLLTGLTPAAGQGPLWAVRAVKVGGVFRTFASRTAAEMNPNSPLPVWYMAGVASVGLQPALTLGADAVAFGLSLPPVMAADGDSPDWLEPDLHITLPKWAAGMVALRTAPVDDTLAEAGAAWRAEFDADCARQNQRLRMNDPLLWAAHFQMGNGK